MQSQRKTGGRPAARPPTTTTATWFHLVSVIYTMMTASAATYRATVVSGLTSPSMSRAIKSKESPPNL